MEMHTYTHKPRDAIDHPPTWLSRRRITNYLLEMSTCSADNLLCLVVAILPDLLNTHSHVALVAGMHKYRSASLANTGKQVSFSRHHVRMSSATAVSCS